MITFPYLTVKYLPLRRSSHRLGRQIDVSDEIPQRTTGKNLLSRSHLRSIGESKVTFLSGQVGFRDLFTGHSTGSHVLCKHDTFLILVRKY